MAEEPRSFSAILEILPPRSTVHRDALERTWAKACEAYKYKSHWSGVPLSQHVLEVFQVFSEYCSDADALEACLLHHALDTTDITLGVLQEDFSTTVSSIVRGVHLLSYVTLRNRRTSIQELRIMLLSVSSDFRVVLLAMCDRLVLLRNYSTLPADEARQIAQDVLQLFAPVAARLGIYALKHQLEELAFPIVYPTDAELLQEQIVNILQEFPNALVHIESVVTEFLRNEGIPCTIETRQKQRYSIFRKLREKSASSIHGIYDFFAVRVLVDTQDQCYQVLGHFHKLARPVTNRFKDYIAFPKPNGYRSVHTTLSEFPQLPPSLFLEVQIRTYDMHREAQYGVAAHWVYKEGASTERAVQAAKLIGSIALQESLDDEWSGMQQLVDHIFVLTPLGNVIELPEGATPLDFAFTVHSDLGLHFHTARVNGVVAPLDHQLQNGDVVEIVKRGKPQPSSQWLSLLKMSSARAKLKKYFLSQERPEHLSRGRELTNEELRRHRLPLLDNDLTIFRNIEGATLTFADREDMLVKIGQGVEQASALLSKCDLLQSVYVSHRQLLPSRRIVRLTDEAQSLSIEGDIPLPLRFAKCCKPDSGPHEVLMGIVSRSAVVMVHKASCRMAQQSTVSRRVRIWWG